MATRQARRSDQEWFDLIMECRQSGLSDKTWCEEHDIPTSTFYNAVTRLRKKACDIPDQSDRAPIMDLTSRKQEVVPISIVPDRIPEAAPPACAGESAVHLAGPYMIEICFGNDTLRFTNSADALLLEKVIGIMRQPLC